MISCYFSTSRLQFFCLVTFLLLNHVVFFSCIVTMVVLSRHGDRVSSHDTSVVTSHVDHVVGLGVFTVSQVPSLGQYVVNLIFVSFWRNEGRLFLRCFPVHRVECCVTL